MIDEIVQAEHPAPAEGAPTRGRVRRLRRRLFTACCVLSLLLCVLVCAMWARSAAHHEDATAWRIRREPDGSASAVCLSLTNGRRLSLFMSFARVGREKADLNFDSYYARADRSGGRWQFAASQLLIPPTPYDSWIGMAYPASGWGPLRWKSWTQRVPTVPFAGHNVNIGVSHWLATALLSILPAWWGSGRLRQWHRRRSRPGACVGCGYDLRATPQRCPECGRPATAPA